MGEDFENKSPDASPQSYCGQSCGEISAMRPMWKKTAVTSDNVCKELD